MSDNPVMDSVASGNFGLGKEPGEQGSIEWLMERVGFVTASRFKDVMDYTKAGKPGAKRTAYLWEVVIERITGKPAQHYENAAMQHGTEHEPRARMAYEARTGVMVDETGFHKHTTLPSVGGSPDGLCGDNGGLEIKCPFNAANHLTCFISGMPDNHMAQIQGLMWITGREWWDFVSYHPDMPAPLDLFVLRIERDDTYIAEISDQVIKFRAEVASLHGQIMEAVA